MFIVDSYCLAVAMCIVTMLCWGSWANTQKLASKEWRFELFYWDYAIGVMLLALVLAFTLGSTGGGGRSFLTNLSEAEAKWLGSAFLGGVIFNLSNILLVAAIDIAGLAVAFPVGVGLALVLGVITTYMPSPRATCRCWPPESAPWRSPFSWMPSRTSGSPAASKNACQGDRPLGGGRAADGFFLKLRCPGDRQGRSSEQSLEPGKLSPYTALVLFSAGLLVSNFLWNRS